MRKVVRSNQPASLKSNSAQWTQCLLSEIKRLGDYSKVDSSFKDKYRQEDVKAALGEMYNNHCCYCESLIGIQTFGRIEHLKPKSLPQFYHLTFEWDNLHWSCEVCNTSYKKTRWDSKNPILDPTKDDIEKHLKLDMSTGEYKENNNSLRAITTIEHTGLNRADLVKARNRLIKLIVKEYKFHKKFNDEAEYINHLKSLKEYLDYPSVLDELIRVLPTI